MKKIYKIYQKTSTNFFLAEINEGYLMIDTGFEDKYQNFIKKLKNLNISPSEIKYIFLTHHHDDHSGFLKQIVDDYNCKVIVNKKSVQFLENGKSEEGKMKPFSCCIGCWMYIFTVCKKGKWEFKFQPYCVNENDIIIENDGYEEFLQSIGLKGKILLTPGHTADSMSLLLDNEVFVGDLAMNLPFNLNLFCCLKHRPIYFEDEKEVFTSWNKILQNGGKIIHTSHGQSFSSDKLKYLMDHI